MKNLRILIAAGPTREYIDPVRYISNDSSGRMGFALAAAAKKIGADVTLISGPVNLETPKGVKRIDVISATDMRKKAFKLSDVSDVIIMAAAVADYRPAILSTQKIKKAARQKKKTIRLLRNPDILAELSKRKRHDQLIVGFAVETDKLEQNALKKLKQKKCDWIIANRHTVIGSDKGRAIMFSRGGRRIVLPELPKEELAFIMLSHLLDDNSPPRRRERREIF